ncbi:MAG: aspartate aminotransferase family protein [Myxococcaceae bacterium]|nr:aspartate aminotransferase family protein [Myxococcaceae bacterium]
MTQIPRRGLSREAVHEQLKRFARSDFDTRGGKAFALSFDAAPEADAVMKEAFVSAMSKTALDMTFNPSVLELENELVAMAAAHLGGDAQTAGTFTSGGTESIMLAVKGARDYFRSVRPDIAEPEMVLPVTAHAAFHKAAHYLGVKVVRVGLDPVTYRADVGNVRAALTPSTILIVGSAGSYAHGVVDPIPELGRLAQEHGVLLHVDGCIGGFLLPYFQRFGAKVPEFDLRVPGVTSISMDLHKYCYAPKGASVVLCKTRELRRHQLFACSGWAGYTIVNTTVQSTKGAGPLAGAWAALNFIGDEGYERIARSLYDAKEKLVAGINAIPRLRVVGQTDLPLIAFTSDTINLFVLIDEMAKRGWHVQPVFKVDDYPEVVHLSVTPANLPRLDELLADLRAVASTVTEKPRSPAARAASLAFGGLDPDLLDDRLFSKLLAVAGLDRVGVPKGTALLNDIMNLLPPRLSERLVVEFINRLFVQPETDASGERPHALPKGPARATRRDDNHRRRSRWERLPGAARALALARDFRERLGQPR